MGRLLSVREAADYLSVSRWTIRGWTNTGELQCQRGINNNRLFKKEDLDAYYLVRTGEKLHSETYNKYYYIRTSNGNDVLMETQEALLTQAFGEPTQVFRDKASGLNENRKSLNQLIETVLSSEQPSNIYVTSKDRLTRFGFNYIEKLIKYKGGEIILLNDPVVKEPHETLMQDFMSLIASFSGKFYRLRGWEQQKKLLKTATINIEEKAN